MRGQVKVYQKKLVEKKRRRAFYITLYTVVVIGFIWAALSSITQLDSLSLEEVVVRGNERLTRGDVELVVKNGLVGNYAGFFSKRNALIYPHDDLEARLRLVPIIKDVKVSRSGFNTVVVTVEEREEAARWCQDPAIMGDGPLDARADCYSVDEGGLIFSPSFVGCGPNVCIPGASGSEDVFTYRGLVEGEPMGQQVLPPADFKNMEFFMRQIDSLSVEPVEARLDRVADTISIGLAGGGRIIVHASANLSTVLQNISVVLKDRTIAPSFSDFLANLDYIKFDAGNKVVYKLKNASVEAQ
ncbi:MAG TPA: FtsQ-type POTRA domain-containing protein [Candidatus Paceibacterota bacterium]